MNFDRYSGMASAIGIVLILVVIVWLGVAGPIYDASVKGTPDQWLGFLGSIIGAAMTIVAAGVAWWAVERQIQSNKELATRERSDLLPLVRQDIENICRPLKLLWRCANFALQEEPDDTVRGWRFANVSIAINYLADVQQFERIASDAKNLGPLNARRIAHVLFCLKELPRVIEAFSKEPPYGQNKQRFQARQLRSMQVWLTVLAREVADFDANLGAIFDDVPKVDLRSGAVAQTYDDRWQEMLDDEEWLRRRIAKKADVSQ